MEEKGRRKFLIFFCFCFMDCCASVDYFSQTKVKVEVKESTDFENPTDRLIILNATLPPVVATIFLKINFMIYCPLLGRVFFIDLGICSVLF